MRRTIRDIQKMKTAGEPIAMLTAYDATSAHLGEAAGAPMLLVGDSLGMVIQGQPSTIPVTLEHIIYHTQMVMRATQNALVIADMPFMTYKTTIEQGMTNAARLMQESGAGAVKLEGGAYIAPTIARIVEAGIPVMAHIGLTPQSVNQFGGFRVQGKDLNTAEQLMADALAVQDAGAFAVVLELLPAPLA
ncbi:MAG: 3-methyl-2-oxobutanoate hydroxymethyltransferase, partial [Anaerolineae bacterium]|nr:3-methyl-2-oxobutanoate hydroxymethyltransferase [Anaerolineae bacterium]